MTPEELISRLKAGETVTLYYPIESRVGVGKRVFSATTDPGKYRIEYSSGPARNQFKYTGALLKRICERGHNHTLWWLAYAKSLELNAEKAKKDQDA